MATPLDKQDAASIIEANRAYYRQTAGEYETMARSTPYTRRHLAAKFLDHLSAGQPTRVLDVGTGTGFALDVLSKTLDTSKMRLVGCDVSPDMLNVARRNLPRAELQEYDGRKLPFADAAFDAILIISVLHHLYDPLSIVREAARALEPGGRMVIAQEPNPFVNGVIRRLRFFFGALPENAVLLAEYHQFMTDGLSPDALKATLSECGLTYSIEYTNAALCDELQSKLGARLGWLVRPLLWFHSRFFTLSYTVVAQKPRAWGGGVKAAA